MCVTNAEWYFTKFQNVIDTSPGRGNVNKLLENSGLQALTVDEEKKELNVVACGVGHSASARARAAELRGHKIAFAFFQSDFNGGFIPYWNVTNPNHQSYQSTLSMEGLRKWKVI